MSGEEKACWCFFVIVFILLMWGIGIATLEIEHRIDMERTKALIKCGKETI